MDLTSGDRIGVRAYDRWNHMPNREAYVLTVMMAATNEAYRAGREDAARDIARVADSTRQSLVSTPPEYGREQYYHRTRAEAFERAVIIARGVNQPRTPSGCDGEDSPEEQAPIDMGYMSLPVETQRAIEIAAWSAAQDNPEERTDG